MKHTMKLIFLLKIREFEISRTRSKSAIFYFCSFRPENIKIWENPETSVDSFLSAFFCDVFFLKIPLWGVPIWVPKFSKLLRFSSNFFK